MFFLSPEKKIQKAAHKLNAFFWKRLSVFQKYFQKKMGFKYDLISSVGLWSIFYFAVSTILLDLSVELVFYLLDTALEDMERAYKQIFRGTSMEAF